MDIVSLFLGFGIGGLLGFILGKRKSANFLSKQELETNYISKDRFTDLHNRLTDTQTEKSLVDEEAKKLTGELATWKQRHEGLEERLNQQKSELEELQEKFKNDFKVLAQEILDRNSKTFREQNKEEIGTILSPFKEKLEAFEKKVEDTYEKGQKERITLKTEVKGLMELNEKLSKEAKNLTQALKGDVKTQGNWGEVILERILEKSGLTKDQEYYVQNSVTSEDGKRFQPDVIIKLPDDKNVIVDSKVSLLAYERFASAETTEEQKDFLKQHVNSIKAHIKGLSDKNYQNLYGIDGLDFVLLFIPIEGAFTLAIQADQNLFQEAFDKNVVVVSTSTLLATLRTISSIWKQEKQTLHALEIARQGGNLYDKFVSFTEDLVKLGKQMDTSKGSYEEAMKKLSSGKDNLIRKTEKLKELGIKATKSQNQRLIDRAEEDNELLI